MDNYQCWVPIWPAMTNENNFHFHFDQHIVGKIFTEKLTRLITEENLPKKKFTWTLRHKKWLALSTTSLSDHRLISTIFNFSAEHEFFACYFFNAQENNGDFFVELSCGIIFSLIFIFSPRIALFDWEIN